MTAIFTSLKHRDFRLFWSGQLIALTGNWMLVVSQGWLVLTLTDSSFYLGLVSSLSYVPFLFFSLPGGIIADRFDKRKLMLFTQSIAMISTLIMAALIEFKFVNIWFVIAYAMIFGSAFAFDAPSRQSIVIDLVGHEDLSNAIALNSAIYNGSRIIGPAIAGILIHLGGMSGCYTIGGIAFVAVIYALYNISWKKCDHLHNNGHSPSRDLYNGLIFAWNNKEIRSILILVAGLTIFIFPYAMLMPVFAKFVLNAGARGLGFLMAATGVGALLGALSLAAFGKKIDKILMMLVSGISVSVAIFLFSLSTNFVLSICILFFVGFSMVSIMANTNTLLQELSGDEYRGRIMSIYLFVSSGTIPLGSLAFGSIAQKIGAPSSLRIGASIFFVLVLYVIIKLLKCCRKSRKF